MEKSFSRDVEVVARGKKKKNLHLMKLEIPPSVFRQNSLDIVSNIKPCKTHITDSKHCCWFIFNESSDPSPGALLIFRCFFSFSPLGTLLLLTEWSYIRQRLSLGISKWLATESEARVERQNASSLTCLCPLWALVLPEQVWQIEGALLYCLLSRGCKHFTACDTGDTFHFITPGRSGWRMAFPSHSLQNLRRLGNYRLTSQRSNADGSGTTLSSSLPSLYSPRAQANGPY